MPAVFLFFLKVLRINIVLEDIYGIIFSTFSGKYLNSNAICLREIYNSENCTLKSVTKRRMI